MEKNEGKYHELEALSWEALRQGEIDEHEHLLAKQKDLCDFRPWITHSFEERSNKIMFHPQMLADFDIIVELGWKILEELNR